jgi:predicted CxxxxCH...CXXCH cytochrome family protein
MIPTGHLALAAPVTAASCAACHPDTVNTDGTINRTKGAHINGKSEVNNLACTTCHGDATRKPNLVGTDANLTSSPPVAQPGAPAYAVGAHLGHLNPTTASYLMRPIACAECHPVPTDQAHATNPPAQPVVFGTLSRTGGAAPTFNATTSGCAATYCHGNFTLGAVSGNRTAVPLWTDGAMTCTSCHGMIPTGHPAYTASGGYTAASCFQCHPQSVNADGTIKQGGGHINGKADGGGCTGCHGDPPRTGSHGDHTRYGCGECHTGYTSAAANATLHQNGVVNLGPSQVGYLCAGKPSTVGCTPLTVPVGSATGPYGTCTNNCHETHTNRRW